MAELNKAMSNEGFDAENEDTQKDKFLTFHIGDEDYGIEIRFVTEIIGIQKITVVPDTPQYIKGVINLRGNVIPVMDVRARFRIEERGYDDRTCIVVVNVNNTSVGLVVDSVNEVINIPAASIQSMSQLQNSHGSQFIQGLGKIGDSVKIILDIQKLLYDKELTDLTAQKTTTVS